MTDNPAVRAVQAALRDRFPEDARFKELRSGLAASDALAALASSQEVKDWLVTLLLDWRRPTADPTYTYRLDIPQAEGAVDAIFHALGGGE